MKTLALASVVLALAASSAAQAGLRVGIYSGTGAEPDKTLALYRAVASAGHTPMAIVSRDVINGRLTTANFDVFILPAGQDGKRCCADHYSDNGDALGSIPAKDAIRDYLNSGGGMVAIEAGAYFAAKNGGTLDIYDADYENVTDDIGKRAITITDPSFGAGTLESWHSYGGGYLETTPTGTVVAENGSGQPVVVRDTYGAGRLILTSMDLELRGDSELDWTIWDNWEMGSHADSEENWVLLGRMIGWAYSGDASAPAIDPPANPTGARTAIVSTRTNDGGAWPGLLPALARSVEYAGHVPLSIRFEDIIGDSLANDEFDVVVFPGGYAYGYKQGLDGHEQRIRDFILAGGSYFGICAGGFYSGGTISWEGKSYSYPLDIYDGVATGPLDDVAAWPDYALTPIEIIDPLLGGPCTMMQTYYGGGYFPIPGGMSYTPVATYAYGGQYSGENDIIRYPYGNGHVVLTGTHPECRAGTVEDWLFWDDYDPYDVPLMNPDNPWALVDSIFDNWLAPCSPGAGVPDGLPEVRGRQLLISTAPNPFRDEILLGIRLESPQTIRLKVYDVGGSLVGTLADGPLGAGDHQFVWDGAGNRARKAPHGVYFVRLESGKHAETRKVVFIGRR